MPERKVPDPKDYPNRNTHKKPKVESVVKGAVVAKDSTLGKKVRRSFLSGDLSELKSYVVEDIIWPGLLKAAHGAVDIAFHRDIGSYNSRSKSVIHYDRASDRPSGRSKDHAPSRKRDFREIIFDTRGDAEEVLTGLVDLIADYQSASVADLYDLCGVTSIFTDNKYGWTDLSGAGVKRVSEGYILDLPKAEQL